MKEDDNVLVWSVIISGKKKLKGKNKAKEALVIYYLSSGWRKHQKPASAVKKFPFIAQREASFLDLNKPYKPYLDSWISEFNASSLRNTMLNNHLALNLTAAKGSMEASLFVLRFALM